MRLGELLDKNTMESHKTIILYFINLIAMVFLLLIYVGLIIIMFIAFLIHTWDRYYGQDDEYGMFAYQSDYHEIETKEQLAQHNKIKLMNHQGHKHWITPFDFSEVQISAWCAFVPGVVFMIQNFRILSMDNMAEYQFFKEPRSLKLLMIFMLTSQVSLFVYVITLSVTFTKQWASGKDITQLFFW